MILQFLGTAAAEGIPALFCPCLHCQKARTLGGHELRTRSGALIDGVIKLDFPPDTYHHILTQHLDFTKLEHVFITHSHSDHFLAEDLYMRDKPFAQKPDDPPLTIYGNEAVGRMLTHATPALRFVRMRLFQPVVAAGYTVTALRAVHMVKSDEETLFYLIEKDGKSILYAHDTDEFTAEDMEFLKGRAIDLISMDCTNGIKQYDYVGHMGIDDNLRMREKLLINGAADKHTMFFCNHFSHNGAAEIPVMEAMADGMHITYDGLSVEI